MSSNEEVQQKDLSYFPCFRRLVLEYSLEQYAPEPRISNSHNMHSENNLEIPKGYLSE